MSDQEAYQSLLDAICFAFPEAREAMDRGFTGTTDRMEAFSALTTRELGKFDPSHGGAYLKFMSGRLGTASTDVQKFIDTYYVEVLFFEAPRKTVQQGWPLVPENLKTLYLRFWGKPPTGK